MAKTLGRNTEKHPCDEDAKLYAHAHAHKQSSKKQRIKKIFLGIISTCFMLLSQTLLEFHNTNLTKYRKC
jgi:hypothetical protein